MTHTALHGLYAITPDGLPDSRLLTQTQAALQGGARIVQYRDKSTDGDRRLRQARALRALCQQYDALFIINDDVMLAAQTQAHGVHLGKQDTCLQQARARLGKNAIIGISCYDQLSYARAAQEQGADYVAFGACFPSQTKPQACHASLDLIRQARNCLHLPIVAIGGINPHNAPLVIEAGAHMLALIQGLFAQPDITSAARQISQLFHTIEDEHERIT